jgi:hypothetical protein
MLEQWTSQDFAPHLHTIFRIGSPSAVELELTEVVDRSNARIDQFSLLFGGPLFPMLGQGTYMLEHTRMGEISLFLVPLGPRNAQMIYQAVFTRLIQELQAPQRA